MPPQSSVAALVAELAKREPQHRQWFETSSAPQLLVHGPTGALADVNHAAVQLYGWPREAMMAMHFTDLGTPEGWSGPLRTRHRTARGDWRDVELHVGTLDAGGVTLQHVIVHALSTSSATEELSLLVRRVGHDLNNALTVIRGATVFLQDVVPPGSQASDDLASIDRAADRAEALTETLQNAARAARDER